MIADSELPQVYSRSVSASRQALSPSETVIVWVQRPPTAPVVWDEAQCEAARWAMQVHGIGPLLYKQWAATPAWAYIPAALQPWLQEQYEQNCRRAALLKQELEDLLASTANDGIPVVPLKGSALIFHYYGDPALRPMADIDVLVRPQDEAQATTCLEALGYTLESATLRHRSFAHPTVNTVASSSGEHPDNPRGVQVHTAISEQFWGSRYTLTEELWQGQVAPFGSQQGWLSNPLTLFQHLLVHASADIMAGKARFIRLYDLLLVAARLTPQDWQTLVAAGVTRREARWLYASLALACRYLPLTIPPFVLEQLAKHSPPALVNWLEQTTLETISFCNPRRVALNERFCWHHPGWETIRAVRHCLFPDLAALREFYPYSVPLPLLYLRHSVNVLDTLTRSLRQQPRRAWLHRDRGGE